MSLPRFEVPLGAIDGANRVYTLSSGYAVGSVAFFLNGQLKRRDLDDGWTETNPSGGIVTVAEAPLPGDVVQFFFLDNSTGGLEEITSIRAVISEPEALAVLLTEPMGLEGRLGEQESLTGSILDTESLMSVINEPEAITGFVRECL